MASALDGITVLDMTEGPAGALATMLLCDHGARVIRVVDIHTQASRRGGYLVWDRGKECIRLDLTHIKWPADSQSPVASGRMASENAHAAYVQLIRNADVVVEDFSPDSERQKLVNADRLSALNARLIHCSITAYGKHGPMKDEPPIDDLVMAWAGILSSQPGYRPGPVHLVHPLPSVGAALLAAIGISAALLAREHTGCGRTVETSLMAGAVMFHPKVTGEKLARQVFQTNPAGHHPFYSIYECADGKWIQIACVHDGFVQAAAGIMGTGIPEMLDNPVYGRGLNPQTPEADSNLRSNIAQVIRTKPYETWAQSFEKSEIPHALVRTTEESMDDPQVRINDMLAELQDPDVGHITQMGVQAKLSMTPGRVKGPRSLPADPPANLAFEERERQLPSADEPRQVPLFELPLKGIRVLEISNLIAGPLAGRLLADLGADVIKMETTDGGDIARPLRRFYFFTLNANKRSLSINTRAPEGKEAVQKLAATVDVLIANLRLHATERMGLGPEVMHKLNPRLIETHLTAFGVEGPYALRPGVDPAAQALMGMAHAQAASGNPPVCYSMLAPTDYTTAATAALGAILALFVRERTGVVQRVDTNLLNAAILLSSEWFTKYAGKPLRPLADRGQYGLNAFHRIYKTADGWLYVGADTSASARQAFCRVLDCEDLLRDSADVPAGCHPADIPLAHALSKRLEALPLDETLARLKKAGVPCTPVLPGDSEVFLDHPQALANDMVAIYQHLRTGQKRVAQNYVRFGQTKALQGKPTAMLGEHSREVLQEAGFTENVIAELYAKGVIKTENPAEEH